MSYLDPPRLHLSGSFYTDPSTVNNDPTHYEPNVLPSPWQEPYGRHWFRLVDCKVISVVDENGASVADPVIGAPFRSVDQPTPAKIVDIDVYQQNVSTIYGLSVSLDCGDGLVLTGACDPPSLNDSWFKAVMPERGWSDSEYGWGSPGGDSYAAGAFQTVIRIPVSGWPAGAGSAVVQQLRAAAAQADGCIVLSFRFTTDAYINVPDAPTLADGEKRKPGINYRRFGRVIGAIGPWMTSDPIQTPGPRMLVGRSVDAVAKKTGTVLPWFIPNANAAPFKVDTTRGLLTIDLANALCRATVNGPAADLGTLTALVGSGPLRFVIGEVPYQSAFGLTAGICSIPIPSGAAVSLQSSPLSLDSSRTDIGDQTLWAEDPSGILIASDIRVVRMASDEGSPLKIQTIPVRVTEWGQPAIGKELATQVVPVHGDTPGATVPRSSPGDTKQANGALKASITPVGANGVATMTLKVVKDPGSRTPLLDGQLYFVYPCLPDQNPAQSAPQQPQVSVLAWSQYDVIEEPTWDDIKSLMAVYDKLFPFMRDRIALTDQHSFTTFMNNPPWYPIYTSDPNYNVDGVSRGAIGWYLTRDDTDPTKMPVSRDLSPNRITTILNYVKNNPVQPTPPPAGDAVVAEGG
ncbi:MAG TPA: hypothetical protein VFL95_06525, partial [Gemmatimonadales bacterium]|nr:hypothetical protein [Gemmatimonadales bacterium]